MHGWTQQAIRQRPNKNTRVYEFLLRAKKTVRFKPPDHAGKAEVIKTRAVGLS